MSNYFNINTGNTITLCFHFNGGLAKPPLKLEHGWVIASCRKQWMWLLIHVLIWDKLSVIKRGSGQWTCPPWPQFSNIPWEVSVAVPVIEWYYLQNEYIMRWQDGDLTPHNRQGPGKWPSFSRRHLQMYVLQWRRLNFDWYFTEIRC